MKTNVRTSKRSVYPKLMIHSDGEIVLVSGKKDTRDMSESMVIHQPKDKGRAVGLISFINESVYEDFNGEVTISSE